jgi:hypothetical protein
VNVRGLRAALALLIAGLAVMWSAPAAAQTPPADDDAMLQELAERFAPVIMLVTQPAPCSAEGEPYFPMNVDALFDNPQIALRQVGNGDPVVTWGPSASDVHNLGLGFYLDFPGSSLEPGCLYEQDLNRFVPDRQVTVYAHVAQSPEHPDQLALQYWFYWYYNDWNNKHESDWEGIQLMFDASSVPEALATQPTSVGYAQHSGGERADWVDSQLERDGNRPVVYSSARSHASYFESSFFLGRGASEGFGCDDTTSPSSRYEPAVIVLPDEASGPDDEFAWLGFTGKWGERHSGAYNGPAGPSTKGRWTDPVTWHEGLREASVTVPAPGGEGNDVIDAFCSVVGWGSIKAIGLLTNPTKSILVLGTLIFVAAWLCRRTVWKATPSLPLVRRRRAGEVVVTSGRMFLQRPMLWIPIGLMTIPLGIAVASLIALLARLPLIDAVLSLFSNNGSVAGFATSGSSAAMSAAVIASVVAAYRQLEAAADGRAVTWRSAMAEAISRWRSLVYVIGRSLITVVLLLLSTILAIFGVERFVRYQFIVQSVMFEGLPGEAAVRRSVALTRGRWFHTALVSGVITGIMVWSGTVVGLLVLLFSTGTPLWIPSVVSLLVTALIAPIGGIALSLLYGDAAAEALEPARPSLLDDPSDSELAPTNT